MVRVERWTPGMRLVGQPQFGRRHFGVPMGGAADLAAAMAANRAAGNHDSAKVLEVFGASLALELNESCELRIAGGRGVRVTESRLEVQGPAQARFYVAVRGGWLATDVPELLDVGNLGQAGPSQIIYENPDLSRPLWITPGLEATTELLAAFISTTWTISPLTDRRGLRLAGPTLACLPEMVSSPVVMGTIQLPPGGSPIILGWDGPTIGGYPRLAHILAKDWDRLGQLSPGCEVRFELA